MSHVIHSRPLEKQKPVYPACISCLAATGSHEYSRSRYCCGAHAHQRLTQHDLSQHRVASASFQGWEQRAPLGWATPAWAAWYSRVKLRCRSECLLVVRAASSRRLHHSRAHVRGHRDQYDTSLATCIPLLACMPTELTSGPVMNGITYDRHTYFYLAVSVACKQTELTLWIVSRMLAASVHALAGSFRLTML